MEISGVKSKRFMVRGLILTFMIMVVLGGLGTWLSPVTPAQAQSSSEETLVKPAPTEEKTVELPVSDKPTASLAVDVLSQYIWRGFALSRNSAVIQPSLTAGYKGFFVNVWGNFDTGQSNPFLNPTFQGAKWNETDFTAGYSRDLYNGTAIKAITASLGVIYYALEKTNNPQGDSFEIYYGLAVDVNWFKLAATANQEVFHYPGWWLTLGISRVFELPVKIQDNNNVTLELGHNFLFLFSRDQVAYPNLSTSDPVEAFSGPLAGQFYATLNVPVHKYVTIAPKIGFWYAAGGNSTSLLSAASWDNQQNHIYGGLNVNFAY
jgi:hypothetical protein